MTNGMDKAAQHYGDSLEAVAKALGPEVGRISAEALLARLAGDGWLLEKYDEGLAQEVAAEEMIDALEEVAVGKEDKLADVARWREVFDL